MPVNNTEIARTKQFAGVMKAVYATKPDYKTACLIMLNMIGLEEFGQVLQNTKKQDWEAFYPTLIDSHYFINLHSRCHRICLEVKKARDGIGYQDIANALGCDFVTVTQTVNALHKGGFRFDQLSDETLIGRPRRLLVFKQPPPLNPTRRK